MLFGFIVAVALGWLAGVWLPWQLLVVVYLWLAVIDKGEGVSSIWVGVLFVVFSVTSFIVGFATSDVTFVQVWEFIKMIFTGGGFEL